MYSFLFLLPSQCPIIECCLPLQPLQVKPPQLTGSPSKIPCCRIGSWLSAIPDPTRASLQSLVHPVLSPPPTRFLHSRVTPQSKTLPFHPTPALVLLQPTKAIIHPIRVPSPSLKRTLCGTLPAPSAFANPTRKFPDLEMVMVPK